MVQTIQEFWTLTARCPLSAGDIFQMLEIPAGTLVLNAGAEMIESVQSVLMDMDC